MRSRTDGAQAGRGKAWGVTVVCGIDESVEALRAARVAAALARALDTPLVLAHAVRAAPHVTAPFPSAVPYRYEELREAAVRSGELVLDSMVAEPGLEQATRRIELGPSPHALAEVAREERADLLVVGPRRRGPLPAALLGSVSRKLLAAPPCPLVLVPPRAPGLHATAPEPGERIVCGVGAGGRSLAPAAVAAHLSRRLGLRLVLAHVRAPGELAAVPVGSPLNYGTRTASEQHAALGVLHEVRRRVADARQAADTEIVVGEGEAGPELARIAEASQARLLVVGTGPRAPLRSAAGPVLAHLMAEGATPVVACPKR
jgi:nucleotide-binding universal stress UspA family protein